MPVNVAAAIRGSSVPQHQPQGAAAPVNEQAVTLRTLLRARTKLLLLTGLALASQLIAFTMVEWIRYFDRLDGVSQSQVSESVLGPVSAWADGLDATLGWARLVAIFATTVLVVVLAVSLLVALTGRLGGTRRATLALLTSIWLWVLVLPWAKLPLDTDGREYYSAASLGPIARFGRLEGTDARSIYADNAVYPAGSLMARHQEIVDMRRDVADNGPEAPGPTERIRREANYFGRFVGYPLAALFLVFLIRSRSKRAYVEAVAVV